jgi:cell division protein FtsB
MNQRVVSLEQQNEALHAENQRTLREVESLAADELSVEQRARDEFNMVYPDELVIDLHALNVSAAEAPVSADQQH